MSEDMREDLANKICIYIGSRRPDETLIETKSRLYMLLNEYEIMSRSTEITVLREDRNEELLKRFIIAKTVKGLTRRTIEYYGYAIKFFLDRVGKTIDDITADDIRMYMAIRLERDKVSKVTVGNELRCVSSMFTWLQEQEILLRNPMGKVEKLKKEKIKKTALTEMEIEMLRGACRGERETFIIELLLSTGCRLSEMCQILLSDIDGNTILVHGKGQKDRYVYLNARAMYAYEKYMELRKDTSPYLFPRRIPVIDKRGKKGKKRITSTNWWQNADLVKPDEHMVGSTLEGITRRIAKRAGVERANPHKFRRTCATMALRRGMPVEQVSKMLGHEDISTTQIYLDLNESDLRIAHEKYVI